MALSANKKVETRKQGKNKEQDVLNSSDTCRCSVKWEDAEENYVGGHDDPLVTHSTLLAVRG